MALVYFVMIMLALPVLGKKRGGLKKIRPPGKNKMANGGHSPLNPWPGCMGKLTRHAHRDWSAWYSTLLYNASVSDIKVHVYRDPPFNWLHPVSDKCTGL